MEAAVSYIPTIIGFGIAAAVSYWVHMDCLKRGRSHGAARFWSVGTFLLLIIFLPLHLIFRPRLPKVTVKQ